MNEISTEGEGACWEGVEMTTSPDQLVCVAVCTLYMLVHMVCSIRVMGLDPNTCTSIINYINHDGPSHLPHEVQLNCSGNGKKNRQWNPRSRTTQRGYQNPRVVLRSISRSKSWNQRRYQYNERW